jgi:hypothetical protein
MVKCKNCWKWFSFWPINRETENKPLGGNPKKVIKRFPSPWFFLYGDVMRCPNCDIAVSGKYDFCPSCGFKLGKEWEKHDEDFYWFTSISLQQINDFSDTDLIQLYRLF